MARGDGIDGARLACIGAPCERDFPAIVRWELLDIGDGEQEVDLRELAHRVKRRGSRETERSVQFAAFQGARKTMIESRFSMKFTAIALSMGLCFAGIAAAEGAAPPAAAPAGTIVGSADAGATKAAVCTACHGVNGNSSNPEWPN